MAYPSPVQERALRALLTEIGYADALIARELPDGQLQLIDGHLRAETTPDEQVPVLVLDVTEEEADKLLLTLDPLAAMAETDAGRIKALLETVRTDDEAVQELLKRTAGERLWRILHPQEIDEAEVAPERADELKAQWGTESGQVWKIEQHRIICGDCTDEAVIARLWGNGDARRLRLIWTDPPYGVMYGAKTVWMKQNGAQAQRKPIHNDDLAPAQVAALFSAALTNAVAHAERGAAIYATVPAGPLLPVFIAAMERGGFGYRHCLVWVKQSFVLGRSDYHYRHEPILYGWRENGRTLFHRGPHPGFRLRGRPANGQRAAPDHQAGRVDCPDGGQQQPARASWSTTRSAAAVRPSWPRISSGASAMAWKSTPDTWRSRSSGFRCWGSSRSW